MSRWSERWEMDKLAAAGILRDRTRRRKALGGFATAMLAMFAIGLWWLDEWLMASLLRFAIYWIACGALCLFVMLFAVFDALSVFREERERHEREP